MSSTVRRVVLKQMKSLMNGFVLHVNNYLENQFSTKKLKLIKNIGHSVTQHWVIFKTWDVVAALF